MAVSAAKIAIQCSHAPSRTSSTSLEIHWRASSLPNARASAPAIEGLQSRRQPDNRPSEGTPMDDPRSILTLDRDSRSNRAPVTVRLNGPQSVSDQQPGSIPSLEISPCVGFSPTTPQYAAGSRIDPPLSVPIAATTQPAATEAADPPLDPPASHSGLIGFLTSPMASSSPQQNSFMFVFPTRMAPRSRSLDTTAASPTGA